MTNIRLLKLCIAMMSGAGSFPAIAQNSPPSPPKPNMLTWPAPETLSPQGRSMSEAMGKSPLPDPWPPVAAQRQFADSIQGTLGAALKKRHGVRIENSTMAGVPVRIILPKGVTGLGEGPILLNLHGGGFSLDSGSFTETIPIAAESGLPVIAVLYRLAPEHPFPAAVDDALAVYQAVENDRGASKIGVFGSSAGAGLGAQLMVRLQKLGRPMPAALGFLSGSGDLSRAGDSESWMPLPNNSKTLAGAMSDYIGKTPTADPALSPSYAELSKFPPTLLLTSTRDFLLSGTSNFARALDKNGVEAKLVVFDGLPHAFWSYMDIPETDEANALVARFMKSKLESTKVRK